MPDKRAAADDSSEVRVIDVQTCSSVSGKSKLTYQVGVLDSEIQLRVHANAGGGLFSNEWIALQSILDGTPDDEPFTSRALEPLFQGRSANTPGFLLAVLKHVGLVRPSATKPRCWERGDVDAFRLNVAALIDAPAPQAKKPARSTGAKPKVPAPAKAGASPKIAPARARKK